MHRSKTTDFEVAAAYLDWELDEEKICVRQFIEWARYLESDVAYQIHEILSKASEGYRARIKHSQWLELISLDGDIYFDVPKRIRDESLKVQAVKTDPYLVKDIDNSDDKLWDLAVSRDPSVISELNCKKYNDRALQLLIKYPKCFKYIHYKTEEMCDIALSVDSAYLKFVPEKLQTFDRVYNAAIANPDVTKYIIDRDLRDRITSLVTRRKLMFGIIILLATIIGCTSAYMWHLLFKNFIGALLS